MTLSSENRAVSSVKAFDFCVPVVDGVGEVSRGMAGLAGEERAAIDKRYRLALTGKNKCGGHAGNSAADNADVDGDVALERCRFRRRRGRAPEGFMLQR